MHAFLNPNIRQTNKYASFSYSFRFRFIILGKKATTGNKSKQSALTAIQNHMEGFPFA